MCSNILNIDLHKDALELVNKYLYDMITKGTTIVFFGARNYNPLILTIVSYV